MEQQAVPENGIRFQSSSGWFAPFCCLKSEVAALADLQVYRKAMVLPLTVAAAEIANTINNNKANMGLSACQ